MPLSHPVSVLFVCHGNICRSVMAQWIFEDLVHKAHLDSSFFIDSAAVSSEETGHAIYPPARRKLQEKGVPIGRHFARRMSLKDYQTFDHLYVMDGSNMDLARRIAKGDPEHKIEFLNATPVDDPWYTGDFETAFREIEAGCKRRLDELIIANPPR